MYQDIIGLFLIMAGLILGLGAVTVIDLHGFLGRKSSYWTLATTRTHKVTKPLIWVGIGILLIGNYIFYRNETVSQIPNYSILIALVLMLNGIFLSFSVSPYLLQKEKEGREAELLTQNWQNKIMISFIFSFLGWWSQVLLLVVYLVNKM